MHKYVLFDLDGTVTDPGEGITKSVAYALKKFNIQVTDRTALYKFIGPPLKNSFSEYYGMADADCEKAIAYYREYYVEKGMFENEVYDGIEELLINLKNKGIKVALATSKPEKFARTILDYFELTKYFDVISGASMDEKKVEKADIIKCALVDLKVTDVSQALMVGDRKYDILGAEINGIDAVGVLFGYGSYEELHDAGAKYIVDSPADVMNVIMEAE